MKKQMQIFKIGRVTHFYDKLSVAVVELSLDLSVGDRIKLARGGEDMYEQVVTSIQIEHNKVSTAKSGSVVGLKLNEKVRPETEIYKIS